MAALLLIVLIRSGALAPDALLHLSAPLGAITIAATCVLVALMLGVYRWQLVLAALGIRLPYSRALMLYWVGAFASTLLPGAVSGDLLRAAFIARDTPAARARAAASVLIDRVIGLLGFALCGLVLLAIRLEALRDSAELRRMALVFALVLGAALTLVLVGRWLGRVFRRRFARQAHGGSAQSGGSNPTWLEGATPQRLLGVLGISLAIPLLLTAALLPFLPQTPTAPGHWVAVTIASVAAQVANTLPLTPGGIGVGEGVFEYLVTLLAGGAGGYATAFLAARLVAISVNAAGGLFLLVPGSPLRAAVAPPLWHGKPP